MVIFLVVWGVLMLGGTIYFAVLQYLIEQNIRKMNAQFERIRDLARQEVMNNCLKVHNN